MNPLTVHRNANRMTLAQFSRWYRTYSKRKTRDSKSAENGLCASDVHNGESRRRSEGVKQLAGEDEIAHLIYEDQD